MNIASRAAAWIAVSLSLSSPLLADQEQAIRQFLYTAYDGRFAELERTWTHDAAGRRPFERQIRNALRVRCLYVDGVAFKSLTDSVAEVDVLLASDHGVPPVVVPLRLRFVSSGDSLRVAAIELPDDELAAQLIAAKGEDRARLMAASSARLNSNLTRAIYPRVISLLLGSDIGAVVPVAQVMREVAILAGDRGGQSLALGALGVAARVLGRKAEGMQLTRESLDLAEASGDPLAITRANINMGRMVSAFDKFSPQVDEYFQRAVEASKRVDDPAVTARALFQFSDQAVVHHDLLALRRNVEEVLRIMEEAGDPFGDMQATVHSQLATLYYEQGDEELALHHVRRGLEALKNRPEHFLNNNFMQLQGMILRRAGRNDEARTALAEALERSRRYKDLNGIAAVLDETASLEAERGNLDDAECLLRESATYLQRRGYHTTGTFHRVVPYFMAAGQYRRALALALEQATQSRGHVADETAVALADAAQAYGALGLTGLAESAVAEAIDQGEAHQEQIAGGELQHAISSESIASIYEVAADLALARGDTARAFALVDRGRGRVLHDIVENGRPSAAAETDRIDEQKRLEHERRLAALNIELARHPTPENRRLLDQARHDYESFIDGLRVRYERRSTTRPKTASSAEEILRGLPVGLTVVQYVVRDRQLHAFVARRTASGTIALTSRTTAIERPALERRVTAFAARLEKGDLRYRNDAKALYALLIGPIESRLAGHAVCIVPDESLWRVPFGALIDARNRFFIERAAVVYAPSVSVYAAVSAHGKESPRKAAGILAVANPVLDARASTELRSFYRGVSLGALPGAEMEADALCAMYRNGRCTVLKRGEATERRAKASIEGRRIVHFATHGVLDDRNPMYSRLVLARDRDGVDDGSLEAWEIARLDLDADLVVLSACDTARGQIGGGEGVIGMAWSFFVAGARSTLATQWRVESSSAARLMIDFHQTLLASREPLRKARALRAAQLRLLRQPRTRHPFYWAPFVLIGDAS